jgi:hypothetical protein
VHVNRIWSEWFFREIDRPVKKLSVLKATKFGNSNFRHTPQNCQRKCDAEPCLHDKCRKCPRVTCASSPPGWPDWASFRLPIGRLFSFCRFFENLRSSVSYWAPFFHGKKLCTYLRISTKMGMVTCWVILFHKLIWSPWPSCAFLKILFFLFLLLKTTYLPTYLPTYVPTYLLSCWTQSILPSGDDTTLNTPPLDHATSRVIFKGG